MNLTNRDLNELPLHQLLRLAVWDVAMVQAGQQTPDGRDVKLDMKLWVGSDDGACTVCMAGAVLMEQRGWKLDHRYPTLRSHGAIPLWMRNIDSLRRGERPSGTDIDAAFWVNWQNTFNILQRDGMMPLEKYVQLADELEELEKDGRERT